MKSKTAGFTLIELAVGIALIALLATVGVPLTIGWIDQSRAGEAAGQVRLAYSKARALALRGQENVFLCVADGVIYVYGDNPGACGSTNPLPAWRARLAGGSATTIRLGSDPINGPVLSCFSFSDKGWLISRQIGQISCSNTATTQITVTTGSKSVSKDIL